MASDITFEITADATAVAGLFEEKALALNEALEAWLVESAELVQETEQRNASKGVTDGLRESVGIGYDFPAKTAAIAPTAPYAGYVEFGTSPHMPPVDAITPWAEMHNLNPWAVAMGIKKNGTAPHPFVKPTAEEVTPIIMATGAAAVKKAIEV